MHRDTDGVVFFRLGSWDGEEHNVKDSDIEDAKREADRLNGKAKLSGTRRMTHSDGSGEVVG